MKTIAIGDTHGRSLWKMIVNNEQFDKFVFIGDYFDSFDIPFEEQHKNFLDIVAYKEANPDKVILLRGNHDEHYTRLFRTYGERYSGFQSKHCYTINHLFQTYKDLFQMAYYQDGHLFTHAGVTQTWLNNTFYIQTDADVELTGDVLAEYINDVWKHKPTFFLFRGNEPHGDDPTQSPIWVRPQSLNEDAIPNLIQVVGHTSVEHIGHEPTKFLNGGSGFFIDTLGSSGEYLVIENSEGVTSYHILSVFSDIKSEQV